MVYNMSLDGLTQTFIPYSLNGINDAGLGATYVPYVGSTSNVDLGANSLTANTLIGGSVNVTSATPNTVAIYNASNSLISSTVTSTTLSYLDATSSVQTQINGLVPYTGATSDTTLGTYKMSSSSVPTSGNNFTNKTYVDTAVSGLSAIYVPYTGATSNVVLTGTTKFQQAYNALVTDTTTVVNRQTLDSAIAGLGAGILNLNNIWTGTNQFNQPVYFAGSGSFLNSIISGSATLAQNNSTNVNRVQFTGSGGIYNEYIYAHTGTNTNYDAQIQVSNTNANPSTNNTGQMSIYAGSVALPQSFVTASSLIPLTITHVGTFQQTCVMTSSSSDTALDIINSAVSGRTWRLGSAGTGSGGGAGNFYIYDGTSGIVRLQIGSTGNFTFTGSVGIGVTPSNPLNAFANLTLPTITTAAVWPAQFAIQGNSLAQLNLKMGAYYTGGVGEYCAIQATETYSGVEHPMPLVLQPIGGYVGIGTTTPSTPLTVYVSGHGIRQTDGTTTIELFTAGGSGWLQTFSNHPLYFSTNNGSPQIALTTNGYVAIGKTSASQLLDVSGDGARIQIESNTANNAVLQIKTNSYYSYIFTDQSGKLQLYPGGGQAILLQPSSGNVGIGTASPSAIFQVNSGATPLCQLNPSAWYIQNSAQTSYVSGTNSNTAMVFSGTGTQGALFSSSGISTIFNSNVNNAPYPSVWSSSTLLIANGISTGGGANTGGIGMYGNPTLNQNFITSLKPGLAWMDLYLSAGTTIFSWFGSVCGYTVGAGGSNVSDAREKHSINDYPSHKSLNKILKLKPKTYKRIHYDKDKDGNEKLPAPQWVKDTVHIGLLAQDVLSVNPGCINTWVNPDITPTETDNGERYGICYDDFIVHLIGAVQEHDKTITSQAATITTLQNQLTKVQADFAAYRALTEQRMDKIGQLLKTVLPSS